MAEFFESQTKERILLGLLLILNLIYSSRSSEGARSYYDLHQTDSDQDLTEGLGRARRHDVFISLARERRQVSGNSSANSKRTTAATFTNATIAKPTSSTTMSSTSKGMFSSSTTSVPASVIPTNKTLTPTNETIVINDTHKYYKSNYVASGSGSQYFLDLKPLWERKDTYTKLHHYLSNANRKAANVKLKFTFPFYGHNVNKVVVTTGGFLHIGPEYHSFIHETHYVAPLMGNFNPSAHNKSLVLIRDDGARLTVQWDSVLLGDNKHNGPFTFQVSLFRNGSIVFAYRDIPIPVSAISSKIHPVKVGLSDGYIKKYRFLGVILVRHVYKYHVVSLPLGNTKANSAYVLNPIPNCIMAKTCSDCFSAVIRKNFRCKWCANLRGAGLCSDSLDWHRQEWELAYCPKYAVNSRSKCSAPTVLSTTQEMPIRSKPFKIKGGKHKNKSKSSGNTAGITIGVILLLLFLIGGVLFFYAYTHPNSKAGLFLIEHHPRRWFRKTS